MFLIVWLGFGFILQSPLLKQVPQEQEQTWQLFTNLFLEHIKGFELLHSLLNVVSLIVDIEDGYEN